MHDPPACGHELQVPSFDRPRVAGKVFVVDGAFEKVCDGLLPAVRVVGETSAWRDVEVVERDEGGEVSKLVRAD